MIDLTDVDGQRVHIQFKHALLFIGARDGQIGPMPSRPPTRRGDGSVDPSDLPEPLTVDQITGTLRKAGEQFILTYPNPIVAGEYIDMFLDAENIASAWSVRAVVVATRQESSVVIG